MTYHDPDHARKAYLHSLDQDKQPLIQRIVRIRAARKQRIEDVLWDWALHTSLDTAAGVDLDRIGAIVGEAREGRSDDRYRLWVRARALLNRSAGRTDEILQMLRLVLGPEVELRYTDIPGEDRNAEAYFTAMGTSVDELDQVADILREAIGAGVQVFLIATPEPAEGTFAFAGGTGAGFGDRVFAGVF